MLQQNKNRLGTLQAVNLTMIPLGCLNTASAIDIQFVKTDYTVYLLPFCKWPWKGQNPDNSDRQKYTF